MRLTVASLVLLVGANSVHAFTTVGPATRKVSPVILSAVEVFDALTQLDPAVAAGLAVSVLGGVGVVASSTGDKKKNGKSTPSSSLSSSSSTMKPKNPELAIPYEAAARLAYEQTSQDEPFEEFKPKYERMTVAMVSAKKLQRELYPPTDAVVDVSIPYDAAARLAYDEWRAKYGKGEFVFDEYEAFNKKYQALTVAQMTAKKLKREMA